MPLLEVGIGKVLRVQPRGLLVCHEFPKRHLTLEAMPLADSLGIGSPHGDNRQIKCYNHTPSNLTAPSLSPVCNLNILDKYSDKCRVDFKYFKKYEQLNNKIAHMPD